MIGRKAEREKSEARRARDQSEARKSMYREREQSEARKVRNKSDVRKSMFRKIDQLRDPIRDKIEPRKSSKLTKSCQFKKYAKKEKCKLYFDIDTGFNFKCCCCLQYKGTETYQLINKLSNEDQNNYIIKSDITMSKDGEFYICIPCHQKIKRGTMAKVSERPTTLVDDIPDHVKQLLINGCQFKDIILADKKRFGENQMSEKSLYPNRLEQFLLKLIIPFLHLGHAPRGRYMQAGFQRNKILDLSQNSVIRNLH